MLDFQDLLETIGMHKTSQQPLLCTILMNEIAALNQWNKETHFALHFT
jgi:hypothetical protein